MRITALVFVLMLAGCAGDRLSSRTKCETVSAVLSNPSATRDQVATAMEMGRNNGCFGTGPPRQAARVVEGDAICRHPDHDAKIDFLAPAILKKWPSVNKERVSAALGARPYMIIEGSLDDCIRKFMLQP